MLQIEAKDNNGRKIEIVNDRGNEISEIFTPIPFLIRIKLDEGMTRYRIKLIDDSGNTRGQYIGTTGKLFLELRVPSIRLPKLGKIRVLVEESSGNSEYSQQHSISLRYIEYRSIKTIEENIESAEEPEMDDEGINSDSGSSEEEINDIAPITKDKEIPLPQPSIKEVDSHDESTAFSERKNDEQKNEEIPAEIKTIEPIIISEIITQDFEGEKKDSSDLSIEEIEYLKQRQQILGENQDTNENTGSDLKESIETSSEIISPSFEEE